MRGESQQATRVRRGIALAVGDQQFRVRAHSYQAPEDHVFPLEIANTLRHNRYADACRHQAERGLNFHRALHHHGTKAHLLAKPDHKFGPTRPGMVGIKNERLFR